MCWVPTLACYNKDINLMFLPDRVPLSLDLFSGKIEVFEKYDEAPHFSAVKSGNFGL